MARRSGGISLIVSDGLPRSRLLDRNNLRIARRPTITTGKRQKFPNFRQRDAVEVMRSCFGKRSLLVSGRSAPVSYKTSRRGAPSLWVSEERVPSNQLGNATCGGLQSSISKIRGNTMKLMYHANIFVQEAAIQLAIQTVQTMWPLDGSLEAR